MIRKRSLIAVNALLVAILACNMPSAAAPQQPQQQQPGQGQGQPPAGQQPVITDTPSPTFTPSPTPTITLTPTPSVPQVSVTAATNCRTGPGTVYDLLYTLQPGQVATIIARDTPDNYWIINMPGGTTCWLWGQYAVVSGNVAILPEWAPPATPTPSLPANPSGLSVDFNCTLTHSGNTLLLYNSVHVEMSWQDNASNEAGYYVYRDDNLLATLGPDETSYSDDTTQSAFKVATSPDPTITYSVQAFNSAGKSKKLNKAISCFH